MTGRSTEAGTPAMNPGARAALHAELVAIVGADHVDDSGDRLRVLDMGGERGATTEEDERAPGWRVLPSSSAQVSELLALANRHGIAVLPVGNAARAPRTAQLSRRLRMFIDTRRMDHVLRLDETSLLVHVQAGLTGVELERILSLRRLTLGDYPPAVLRSTMGGLLSVRTPGKSSARHGFFEDAVLGVSAVLADGRTIHTRVAPRRATGPDLMRALCGSEGTLGFITSVVLRIHRMPEARFLSAYALPDFDAALSAVYLALREEAAPSALRAFDHAEALARLGAGVCRPGEAVITAATAGPTDLAACDRDLIASATEAMGGRVLDASLAKIWWYRRTGKSQGAQPPPPLLQVTAPPSKQKAVYRAVVDAVAQANQDDTTGEPVTVRAHASRFDRDGAVLFFTMVGHESGIPVHGERERGLRELAEAAARAAGGVPFGDNHPSQVAYVEALRRELDPNGIMNPGALRQQPG